MSSFPRYLPEELGDAVVRSRAALPEALGALHNLIWQLTGREPDYESVKHVSTFWLMHLCDLWSHALNIAEDSMFKMPKETVYTVMSDVQTSEDDTQRRLALLVHLIIEGSIGSLELEDEALLGMRTRHSQRRSLLLSRISPDSNPVMVTMPYLKVSALAEFRAAFSLRELLHWDYIQVDDPPDSSLNSLGRLSFARAAMSGTDNYRQIRAAVALTVPKDLAENYWKFRESVSQRIETPRLIYTANAHQTSTAFMHFSSVARNRGSKLLIHQHGGGYGIDAHHLGEDHDIGVSDIFYSFGWVRKDLPHKVKPLPAPMPPHTKQQNREVLLVSLEATQSLYRLQAFCMPSHVARALDLTREFLTTLDESISLKFRHAPGRPIPRSILQVSRANITEDLGSEPATIVASRSALAVHNYLGTSWLETLALNIPTVCFFDPKMFYPRNDARSALDSLARVGILHSSGRSAARFVNTLSNQPLHWWYSDEVQDVRSEFTSRFANFSTDWLRSWEREFRELLERDT